MPMHVGMGGEIELWKECNDSKLNGDKFSISLGCRLMSV